MEQFETVNVEENKKVTVVRSRFKLLLICWLGWFGGKHLKWLVYDEEAENIKSRYGNMFALIFRPAY